jgi:hypothetical protein
MLLPKIGVGVGIGIGVEVNVTNSRYRLRFLESSLCPAAYEGASRDI